MTGSMAAAEQKSRMVEVPADMPASSLHSARRRAIPRLPAIPYFDRTQFDWAPAIEAATPRTKNAKVQPGLIASRAR